MIYVLYNPLADNRNGSNNYSRSKKNLQNYRDSYIMTITLSLQRLTVLRLVPTE